jgi:hypothetical protein
MSDTLSIDPTLKVHFGFERKKNLGNYEHALASANVSVDLPLESDQAEVVAKLTALAASVKLAVLTELGIDVSFEADGSVQEKAPEVAVQLSVPDAAAKLNQAFAPAVPQPRTADPGEREDRSVEGWGKIPAAVVAEFLANPDAFYDNRATKAPGSKGPDLKRKIDGKGFWIVSKF